MQQMLSAATTFVRPTSIGMDLSGSVRVEMAFTISLQLEQRGSLPKMVLRVMRFFRSTKIAQEVFGSERGPDSTAFPTGSSARSEQTIQFTKKKSGLFSKIVKAACGLALAVEDSTA